ncbi:hypothetical protein E2542_SST23255 [Spatholobus suberectus]|nr:hypothetical protein E2542_SST23255 [Spatholobus suberectus]
MEDGDNGELSDIANLLDFNYASDDLDMDLFLDANENLPMLDDGSFLETNDLGIVNEGDHPTEADHSGNDMLDEYLAIPDDDVCNYISFDSPQIPESENAIPIQGSPFIQQNVEGEEPLIMLWQAMEHNLAMKLPQCRIHRRQSWYQEIQVHLLNRLMDGWPAYLLHLHMLWSFLLRRLLLDFILPLSLPIQLI